MAEKRSTVILNSDDQKIAAWLRRALSKEHGKVTFSFVVRQALRALAVKLGA